MKTVLFAPVNRGFLWLVDRLPMPSVRTQSRFALAVLLSQALIAVTGSVVRVTSSGLGCPTWPKCFDDSFLPVAQEDVPWWHQAIEFGNRQIAVWVVIVASVAVVVAVTRARRRREILVLAWVMPLSTFAQAIIGGITVLTGLLWWIVAAHMLISCAMVWVAAVLYAKVREPDDGTVTLAPRRARALAVWSAVVMALVLVAGTMVTAAGPHAGDKMSERAIDRLRVSIPLLTSIHGLLMALYLALIIALGLYLRSALRSAPWVRQLALRRWKIVVIVVCAQGLVGVVQYFTNVPALLVVIHVAGAASVVAETALLYAALKPRVATAVHVAATHPVAR